MNDDHPVFYADRAWHGAVRIEENAPVARDTYRVRFACAAMARAIVPGQFLMVRLPEGDDPLLGRPLALYDTVLGAGGKAESIDVVYLAVGKMTRRLAALSAGSPLEVWGPLGNGFPAAEAAHLVMVAGGIGYTPFAALAAEALGIKKYGDPPREAPPARRATLCLGARSADYLGSEAAFREMGVEVLLSTDDGSAGHHGLVTDLAARVLASSSTPCRVVACGPEAMMKKTVEIAGERGVPCHVSLESPMACGLGICFSCVAKVRDATGRWDYRRTCVEGPVFDGADVEF
jgi:dihydroorotate dehydrogenase electron transfer subunit